jgi:hypothetical protein
MDAGDSGNIPSSFPRLNPFQLGWRSTFRPSANNAIRSTEREWNGFLEQG